MEIHTQIRPGRTISLTVHENPHSDATAFLIHGLGGRGAQWRKQIDILRERYTLVIPDLPGHGKSVDACSSTANPYSFPEFEKDLHAIFNQYAGNKNIILGHSYGGALATALAIDHQDKISKLVLLAPTPCIPSHSLPLLYHLPVVLMECIRPVLDYQFRQLAFTKKADPALIRTEMEANKKNPMRVIRQVVKGMQQIPRIDLTMLNTSSLIITGEGDKLVSPLAQQQFYQNIPHHEFRILPHASHMAMLEEADIVNGNITEFLQK